MNRLDQQEPTGHNGDPKPLDRIKSKAAEGFAAFTGRMTTLRDRLTEQYRRLTDPDAKSMTGKRQSIKPVRVEPAEPSDRHDKTEESPDRMDRKTPSVARIDATAPVVPVADTSPIDEAPDRTFERNRQPDRPDLYHVTPGKPSLIEDTAVHEIVNTPERISSDETMVTSFVRHSRSGSSLTPTSEQAIATHAAQDMAERSSVRVAPGSASVLAQDPVTTNQPNALDRYLPGVRSFLSYYRKRRKADRAIRRNTRERVYRLKGYTTVAKVNRKRQSEKKQRLLRRALIGIIAILTLVILFQLYNPFKDLSEWYRILGIRSLEELTQTTTTASTSTSSGQIIITAPATTNSGLTTSATTTAR